jgi:hypothetical protein
MIRPAVMLISTPPARNQASSVSRIARRIAGPIEALAPEHRIV